jgi:NSS family neurotransmitter:Na+ symporter
MMDKQKQWSSSAGFVMACVGSAVGLGNIWKFPYIAHHNGGGAFVFVYLVAVLLVGLPIIIAEMMLGRHGQHNVFENFKIIAKGNPFWKLIGVLCLFTAALILSYYSVVAGWTFEYLWKSLFGQLSLITPKESNDLFVLFISNGWKQVGFHSLFMFLTALIVVRGTSGIEKAVKVLMPVLFIFVLVIAGISIYTHGAGKSFNFLFSFDFSKLTPHAILEAVGHAFFTLSVGMGSMMIYGSYLSKEESIFKAGVWIVFLDTLIAIMACFMMYPIIFGNSMELSSSASMLFTTLSVQFNSLPGGNIVGAIFYLLVAFAALSSTISLLEPVVSFTLETLKISRNKATIISTFSIWLLGVCSALSNGAVKFLTELKVLDRFDYLASNWTLPIGGMLISIFCGYVLTADEKRSELTEWEARVLYPTWNFLIRYVSPLLVFIVILNMTGLFSK